MKEKYHYLSANELRKNVIIDEKKLEEKKTTTTWHERAKQAIKVSLNTDAEGFNAFVYGESHVGKFTTLIHEIINIAKNEDTAKDWIYVYNFCDNDKPIAIKLPVGQGKILRDDVNKFLDHIKIFIPNIVESEEFQKKQNSLTKKINKKQQEIIKKLEADAKDDGLQIINNQNGLEIKQINENSNEDGSLISQWQDKIDETLQELSIMMRDEKREQQKLWSDTLKTFILPNFNTTIKKWKSNLEILSWLRKLKENILENAQELLNNYNTSNDESERNEVQNNQFKKYQIVLFVDNSNGTIRNIKNLQLFTGSGKETYTKAPIIYEDNPTLVNVFGKIETSNRTLGACETCLIKAGSIHMANNGYLIINARNLLEQPQTWEAIKRTLRQKQIKFESTNLEQININCMIDPMPIDLSIKVILISDTHTYFDFLEQEPELEDFFKISAEFDYDVERNPENKAVWLKTIKEIIKVKKLPDVEFDALIILIEEAISWSGINSKISVVLTPILDIIQEAKYYANNKKILKEHIIKAIEAKTKRYNRAEEIMFEEIAKNVINIQTSSRAIGQMNALTVVDSKNYSFGMPSRTVCTVSPGWKEITNIERESNLSGLIHSKGVMILSSFMAYKFGAHMPLAFSARIAFEQSYMVVDGDSASAVEACVLLSALADIPIIQNYSATGAIDQFGKLQAVGGINEKIKGFYNTLKIKGQLNEKHKGCVIIPKANIINLMVDQEISDAVQKNHFNVIALDNIDELMEIITEVPIKEIEEKVTARLKKMLTIMKKLHEDK